MPVNYDPKKARYESGTVEENRGGVAAIVGGAVVGLVALGIVAFAVSKKKRRG